jgi:hypothetical protein
MNKSEDIKDLAAALSKAQAAMGGAKKAQTAEVTTRTGQKYKYNYATMESIVDAVREPFASNGLSFTQLPAYGEGNEVRVETALLHVSGQWITNEVRIPVNVADAQGYGSAFTYACKYGLRAIAGVPAVEDDDGEAAVKAKPRATEEQMMPKAVLGPAPTIAAPIWKDDAAPGHGHGTQLGHRGNVSELPGMQPHEKQVRFQIGKANYTTAGMTKEQMVQSFDLVTKVNNKHGKGTAEALLKNEFGVVTRADLTFDNAEKYLTRLTEIANNEDQKEIL